MTIWDPFAYRPAGTAEETSQRLVQEVSHRLGAQERADAFAAFSVQSPWITPTMLTGFSAQPGLPPRYYIDPTGRVYFEGYAIADTPPALPAHIFELELGYLPPYLMEFHSHKAFSSSLLARTVTVYPDGAGGGLSRRVVVTAAASSWSAGDIISLNQISYRVPIPGAVIVSSAGTGESD